MSRFRQIIEAPENSRFVLQGNEAFALGVIHAGYHAADGYPGTPSTEVIDKSLAHVQDLITVGWSINETIAVAVAVGHAIAGKDAVVTMKIPGVFQAGDAITTSAFYTGESGALVIYAATDYVPSSTQHVVDSRYFFVSARLPVLEPRNHQEMYEIAWFAADISRQFKTPVVILASGILAHSEGLVITRKPRKIEPRPLPENLKKWMLLPAIARSNYNIATRNRIPDIQIYAENSQLIKETHGSADWGIVVCGESDIIVREALKTANLNPSIFSMAISYPIPKNRLKDFRNKIKGKMFLFEDGDTFLEERLRLEKIELIGKNELSGITDWTPEMVLDFLAQYININYKIEKQPLPLQPVLRPPSICPGCPYRAFSLAVDKLKKKKKIYAAFGDIGCSTLIYFQNAIDTVMCMGASDSMRQGFVLSQPEMIHKTISVIGDSCECHSGMDSTRNAVFRNIAGVKVILDNRTTAMTGAQPSPASPRNLAQQTHKFNLRRAIEAEGCRTITVNAYDLKEVELQLENSLLKAKENEFTAMIVEGACVQEVETKQKVRTIEFDYDKCRRCQLCNICPGIDSDADKKPFFTPLCTNCGSSTQICMQRCPFGAIVVKEQTVQTAQTIKNQITIEKYEPQPIDIENLPKSLRLAIRGIGGQGNLFFGKVLSELALRTPYINTQIVKGDTHGMAQLGGAVISTFSCGEVFSPLLAPKTADILVVMEISEVLRPNFIDLLKPQGTIIFNNFKAKPALISNEQYPKIEEIENLLVNYNVIKLDATKIAIEHGDKTAKTANVIILGLLSTLAPFNAIPYQTWLAALMAVSPTDTIKIANKTAFDVGRKIS